MAIVQAGSGGARTSSALPASAAAAATRRSIPASVFVSLKPLSQRNASVDQVIARLRPKLAQVPGGRLYLAAVQDLRAGGRQSNAQYQYTLQSEDVQRAL